MKTPKALQKLLILSLVLALAVSMMGMAAAAESGDPAAENTAAEESAAVEESAAAEESALAQSAQAGGRTFTWNEGEPLVLHIKADEGFRMPAVFTLKINDTEYSVRTDGGENPEGISYNAETGELSIASGVINNGDSFVISGAAVGVSVDLAGLENITVKESIAGDVSAALPLTLTLVPAEGYKLPAELKLMLGETEYTVYTDGSAENPEGITFDAEKSELKIDASLLEIGLTLSITAKGEELAEEPEETKKPEETEEPEESAKPEETEEPEKTKQPEESKEPEEPKEPEASATPAITVEPAEKDGKAEDKAEDKNADAAPEQSPKAAESTSPAPTVSASPAAAESAASQETPTEEAPAAETPVE